MWLAMTLAFEFGAGHYLFHTPWAALIADYNILRGRLWILVLAATLTAPTAEPRRNRRRDRAARSAASVRSVRVFASSIHGSLAGTPTGRQ